MDEQVATGPTVPGSFWVVAVLGLLWNSFGAYLYTMANLGDASVTAGAPPAMLNYIAHMPVWAHAGWAFGIWGSFAGSVLMVLRKRLAISAFLVSITGAVVSYAGQAMAHVLTPAEPAIILTVIVFFWWYSSRSARLGYLR